MTGGYLTCESMGMTGKFPKCKPPRHGLYEPPPAKLPTAKPVKDNAWALKHSELNSSKMSAAEKEYDRGIRNWFKSNPLEKGRIGLGPMKARPAWKDKRIKKKAK